MFEVVAKQPAAIDSALGWRRQRRIEPRSRWPHQGRRRSADKVQLAVSYVEGRKHLPVIELRRAA